MNDVGTLRRLEEDGGGRFGGQVALVTGAASGIGLQVAKSLSRGGAHLVLADLIPERTQAAAESIVAETPSCEVLPCSLDVRSPEDVEDSVASVLARFGRIDILVASAGILRGDPGQPKTVVETSPEAWDKVIDTNLTGLFLTNRAVLPTMIRQRRGNIVNLSSLSGRRGHAYDAAYCASKFGVIGLSEVLQEEVRPHGIRVHVILPDVVDTPMLDQNGPLFRPKQVLTPERVAGLILYVLGLPEDTFLMNAAIGPFRSRH